MDANRIAVMRKALQATTDVPDVCIMHEGIYIASAHEPQQRQVDASFYRQVRGWMRELLDANQELQDENDQLHAACLFALTAAEHCQEGRNGNGCGPAVRDGVSGSMDG